MKWIDVTLRSVMALLLALGATAHAFGQSDRPCGAPFMSTSNCGAQTLILFSGSSFQADAPLPAGCNLAFSHDVWVQVVAPSSNPVVSVGTYRASSLGGAVNPLQIHTLLYEGSPDCNTLSNVGGCPSLCSIGVVCITIENFTGEGRARRFTGLTTGNTYYLRVLWEPNPNPAFDTVYVTLRDDGTCIPCDPCGGGAAVLAEQSSPLAATWVQGQVALVWEPESLSATRNTVFRSSDAQNWAPLDLGLEWDGRGYQGYDRPPHASKGFFYQIRSTHLNGEQEYSKIAFVSTVPGAWLRAEAWQPDVLEVQVDFKSVTQLRLLDLQGRSLWESAVQPGLQTVAIPRQPFRNGLYLLQPHNAEGLPSERIFFHAD
jgi:hypothetical protein